MCGICGVVGAGVTRDEMKRMRDAMKHRGPDGKGLLQFDAAAFGHRRLSIIDLTPAGRQPMQNEDGSIMMTMNGEIYNYRELGAELRRAGHRFHSECDAEVLVHLYEDLGEEFVRCLNGIFAIAIWDERQRKLVLARDHLGVKPLYYTEVGGGLAFASEIRPIRRWLEEQGRPAGIDPRACMDYVLLQYPLGTKTFYRGIERLLPGEMLTWDAASGIRRRAYWNLPEEADESLTLSSAADQLRGLLEDSVRLQLRSDVPLGVHLSGGIDTATVAGLAVRTAGSLHAFTGAFAGGGEFDDSAAAGIMAARIGANHHIIRGEDGEFPADFAQFTRAMEEPMAGPGGYAQFLVSRRAAVDVKVVLGGQGADEVFGGYARHLIALLDPALGWPDAAGLIGGERHLKSYGPLMARLAALAEPDPVLRYLELVRRDQGMENALHPDLVRAATGYSALDEFRAAFSEARARDPFDRILRFETRHWLPALLHVEDRTSMAHSLESRVPLLDHRIVELGFRIPSRIKLQGGTLKAVLRHAVGDLLPAEIVDRSEKIGFPVPARLWRDMEIRGANGVVNPGAFGRAESSAPDARLRWAGLSLAALEA